MSLRTLALALILAAPLSAQDYRFAVSSVPGAAVVFDGTADSIQFTTAAGTGHGFEIDGSDFGEVTGLFGRIDGTFFINAASIAPEGPTGQSAEVTGSGVFSIFDGSDWISAELVWNRIHTVTLGTTLVGLNLEGAINLTNFSGYAGDHPRLLSFLGYDGSVTLGFAAGLPQDITSLTNGATSIFESFSGPVTVYNALAVIPEPAATTAVAGLLVLGFAVVMQTARNRSTRHLDV